MAVARWLETDTHTDKDISAAVSIGVYTADADRLIVCDVSLLEVAGNGDYVAYITRQINGAGSHVVMGPKTTLAAASGETAVGFQSGMISVRSGDVLTVMVDGLAGDTATPDTIVRWFEMATLRPVTADRQVTVAATGEASANVTMSTGVALSGRLAEYADLPAAAPSAASVADAVWDEAISGHLTAGTTGAKLNTASAASGAGSTAYSNTITDDSSNPLDGVEVWITSDSGGASTVASTTTNTLGAFTVYLDPGTYYLWLAKGGYNFPNPTTITVT
jgi:hypothetical protein